MLAFTEVALGVEAKPAAITATFIGNRAPHLGNYNCLFLGRMMKSVAFLLLLQISSSSTTIAGTNSISSCPEKNPSILFREYIGSQFTNVTFTDVPISPHLRFDFILAFAIDYTNLTSPSPTNGIFNIFWDSATLSPTAVSLIKKQHSNVHVSVSIGGYSVGNQNATFKPKSIDSWVYNAVSSIKPMIKEYYLDGIDIDYEHFDADPETFAECIGRLIEILKKDGTISTASIAPFADEEVQLHYLQLWRKYGNIIDYVNFQFYAFDNTTTKSQFLTYFVEQTRNYEGGKVLASFISDWSKGLSPKNGFFKACSNLLQRKLLHGIFVWCADESKKYGFRYEAQSQKLLAGSI